MPSWINIMPSSLTAPMTLLMQQGDTPGCGNPAISDGTAHSYSNMEMLEFRPIRAPELMALGIGKT